MTLPTWVKPVAALVALGAILAVGVGWYHSIQRNAVLEASIASTQHSLDSLAKVAIVVDTAYVHDTVRLTHTKTVYTERRDTLLLNTHDTVQVIKFVQAADSVVKACSLLQLTCEQRHQVDSATAAGWERIAKAERKAQPSVVLSVGEKLLYGAAGAAVCALTHC